jgi:VWFA-related protein
MHSLLFIIALSTIAAQSQPRTPAPPARAELWIDVTTEGRHDAPVTDLTPKEFEVWISGYRIPITDVVAVTPESGLSRTVVVILDNASVPPVLVPRVREAARLLVDRLAPGDRMAIVPLNGGVMQLTDDRMQLRRAIDSYNPQPFPFRIEDAGEHVLQMVTDITRQLTEVSDRRKTIVAIGAGWLFDTPLPPPGQRDLGPLWVSAMRAMGSAYTTLYVIDPAGLGAGPTGYFGGENGFARETGGHAFMNTNDFRGPADRIWRETGSYYMLGIANPPVQRSADLREIEVKVLRKGVTVRTRSVIRGKP